MNLTLAFITSRKEPKSEWFMMSLKRETGNDFSNTNVIIVSTYEDYYHPNYDGSKLKIVPPKPTIWQGEHRITKEDWWAKSNALNTAIILCRTEFIAFVDDRCVLSPQWLQCVREAMEGGYAVCGSYEKRANMKVENGEIVDQGELLGADTRRTGFYPFDSW